MKAKITTKAQSITSGHIDQARKELTDRVPFFVLLLLASLLIPIIINLGALRLSAYRIILIILFFFALGKLLSGRAGRLNYADYAIFLICSWASLSFIVNHGLEETTETIGIYWIEVLGAHLIARCYILGASAFYQTVRLFFILTIIIFPFAIAETITAKNYILDFFGRFFAVYQDVFKDPRWGLDRVQGPLFHPIAFGVFFGSLIGLTYYVLGYGRTLKFKFFSTGLTAFVGALALSSGPLTALVTQVFFIIWDHILKSIRSRWYILSGLAVLAYFIVDAVSNRNPFVVFVSYLAFSTETAINRIFIFHWGIINIMENPLFGLGLNEWKRYFWMSTSADMFWLVPAMRHGIFVGALYLSLFFWVFLKIAFKKIDDPKVRAYRTGYLTTLLGIFMAGWTVHYWDGTLVLFHFLLASGIWFVRYQPNTEDQAKVEVPENNQKEILYTRFPS